MFLKLLERYEYTHMPYIFYKDMQPKMLFTVMQNSWWKLYYCDGKKCYKIKTPLDEMFGTTDYHMCQPTCYFKDNIYHVSFCIQLNGHIKLFYVQTKNIKKFQNVTLIQDDCYGGCVNQKYIFINYINSLDIIDRQTNKFIKELRFKISNLSRTSYIYNHLDELLISWVNPRNTLRCGSFLLDINNPRTQKEILTKDEKPVYKATFDPLTNTIYYGEKIGLNLQQRKIRKLNGNQMKINNINILTD